MGASKRSTGPVGNALGPSLGPNRCDISDYHCSHSINPSNARVRPARSATATILLPFVLVVSHIAERARHLGVKMVVCLGPLLVLVWVIVIARYSAATSDVLNAVLPDTSFTGRTDVWRFAIDHAMERPLTGYGFMAFWRTPDVFLAEMANFWANLAAHSHDGYLDIALTTGLPGLAFTLLLVVVMPLINFHNRVDGEANRVLSLLCLRFWLFGIYVNCFESALFDRGNPIWFFLLSASFGLHFRRDIASGHSRF
jgi:O-antigen ligase